MSHRFMYGLITALVVMAVGGVNASETKEPGIRRLGLVTIGDVDEGLVDRVYQFTAKNLAVKIRRLDARPASDRTLNEEAKSLAETTDDDPYCIVAIARPNKKYEAHDVRLLDKRVAIINLTALDHEDKETFARRVEKCVMRNFGFLLGLSPSPNPQSALYPYVNLRQLDQIGRNFDPPYMRKFQEAARDHGLIFDKESPYYMGF